MRLDLAAWRRRLFRALAGDNNAVFDRDADWGTSVGRPHPAGRRGIWQRRFWEHTIRDDRDYANHLDYVHFNPVRHGLVARVGEWPYSSFNASVARGLYPADWAAAAGEIAAGGERR